MKLKKRKIYFKFRAMGGEGVIVRDPTAPYVPGYSPYLFKHRGVHDAEAEVIQRKYDGILLCKINLHQLAHNAKFDHDGKDEVTKDEKERKEEKEEEFLEVEMEVDEDFEGEENQIQNSSFVSFKYLGLQTASHIPIYVIRSDISRWEQVLHSKKKTEHQRIWSPPTQHQDWKDKTNHRNYFLEIAKKKEFDPLISENWYSIERKDLPNASGLLQYYNNSYITALISVFPELHFDPKMFKFIPQNYWNNKDNRRQFFDEFAKSKSIIDPLLPHSWHSFTSRDFASFKGGSTVLSKYDGNVYKALSDVYPFIPFNELHFDSLPVKYWHNKENCRAFFNMFAKNNNFDPLNPENWYTITNTDISSVKHGSSALSCFNGSLVNALKASYPDLSFSTTKFSFVTKNYWAARENRRQFFDEYAKKNHFNPLIPSNWHSVTLEDIYKEKRAGSVLHYHNNSLKEALIDSYPELKFNVEQFKMSPKNHWTNLKNRKSFFDQMAKTNQFNPLLPSNWYSISSKDIFSQKGGSAILAFYKQSFINALLEAYPNIGLRETKFDDLPANYFSNIENRRKFFEEFAKDQKFDPLIASNWTSINIIESLNSQDHGNAILSFYQTWENALKSLYPLLSWPPFPQLSSAMWNDETNRKKIFEQVAKAKHFNPLLEDNWYSVSHSDIIKQKGGSEVMKYYGNSILRALHELYNFNLSKTKYRMYSKS